MVYKMGRFITSREAINYIHNSIDYLDSINISKNYRIYDSIYYKIYTLLDLRIISHEDARKLELKLKCKLCNDKEDE